MCRGGSGGSAWKCFFLHGQSHASCMQSPCQLTAQHSGISNDVLLFSEVGLSLVHHYRVHRIGRPHAAFRGKYLGSILLTAGGPSGAACSPVSSTARQMDILGATPRRPGRRRRQTRIMDMPAQTAPRLTEQDPCKAAGAVVFDCWPTLLTVSLDVSGYWPWSGPLTRTGRGRR